MDSPFIVHFHSDDFFISFGSIFFWFYFMCQLQLIVNSKKIHMNAERSAS
jgi:uncharacterized membrane protein